MRILNKEARQHLKSKLPGSISNGYDLIQEKLPDLSRQQVEKAFNSDAHYREDVMEAALEIVEESKRKSEELEKRINAI